MRRALLLGLATSLLAGCGTQEKESAGCPAGTRLLHAGDVLRIPAGYALKPGTKALARLADQLRAALGDGLRSAEAQLLVGRGTRDRAEIIVLNSKASADSVDGLLADARKALGGSGTSVDPLTVGGREALLLGFPDGSSGAAAPAGDCGIVFILAEDEPLVRRLADAVVSR